MFKKIFFCIIISMCLLTSCDKHADLYKVTDKVVNSLYTEYESYGLQGDALYTKDGKYKVMPVGRLVNVRIEDVSATSTDYQSLEESLKKHYKNNERVNDVYICGGGTVMIDCRR